jgi:hypothetical protein
MPRVEIEPTIPVFERAKTVHDSDIAANVDGYIPTTDIKGDYVSEWISIVK